MEYSIETYELTKKFVLQKGFTDFLMHPLRKDEITAVEKVNIKIGKGELFGTLGPNGSPEELKSELDKPNSTLDDVFLLLVRLYFLPPKRFLYTNEVGILSWRKYLVG